MLKDIRNITLVGYVYKNGTIKFVLVWDVERHLYLHQHTLRLH